MNPYISIIIPTLNEERYLPHLLTCIKNQTYKNYEIIVADAFSTDKTREIAHLSGALVIDGGLPGLARNNGANIAKGKLLLFCDADIVFGKHFLSLSVKKFEKRNLSTANFLLGYYPHELFFFIFGLGWNCSQIMCNLLKMPIGSTQCLLTTKENFEELKGFSATLSLAEDQDFIERTVTGKGKFGIVNTWIGVSPRRFKKFGYLKVAKAYIQGKRALKETPEHAATLTKELSNSIGGYGNW